MSFDSSRFTFDPRRDFLGVVMEQGRVQLDSDWNEWQAEFARRIQAGTLDILGQAVYPINITPNAFQITPSTDSDGKNHISIGAGRYYVDGLLAENHGPQSDDEAWDPALAELSGAPLTQPFPDMTIDFTQQPYYPGATISGSGPFLAYLDVWQREVTYLEDPYLVDQAVGVDTTGRLQTVWQVKLIDLSKLGGSIDCSTDIPAWDALLQPPTGRLTNGVAQNTPSVPCCLASTTGYTGLENQLYRVEIQKGGASPTFKWSRDNASVATSVTAINTVNGVSQLTVASQGRDQVLGFSNGDWIEITDDYQELTGVVGELHQITGTSATQMTITLDSEIALSLDPTNLGRHTRIVRWDQQGTTTGDIAIPSDGSAVTLESGINVSFSNNPTPTSYNPGDFWNFDARTANGHVQPLNNAPPRGIHHHYAKLAIVTFPTTTADCRVPWPPTNTGCCGCSVSVQPTDITANYTLQNILDKYKNLQTATEICLAPGTYNLTAPLRFTSAHTNITLKACQTGTAVLQAQAGQESQFADGLIVLDNVTEITLKGLQFELPVVPLSPTVFAGLSISTLTNMDPVVATGAQSLAVSVGVRPINSTSVTIEECLFDLTPLGGNLPSDSSIPFGVGILACGQCTGMQIEENEFQGAGSPEAGFLAGFLLAPSVSFNAPPAYNYPIWGDTGIFSVTDTGQSVLADLAPSSSAKLFLAQKTTPSAKLNAIGVGIQKPAEGQAAASHAVIDLPVSHPIESTTTFAAYGGSVVPAVLNNAAFSENSFSGLTNAAMILGESEFVQFLSNQVSNCHVGFWLVSPSQTQSILFDWETSVLAGALVAMSYPLPQGDTTTPITVAPAPASVRIYTGPKSYTDSNKNVWTPDAEQSASFAISGTSGLNQGVNPPSITDEDGAADPDPTLYDFERWGPSFAYTFEGLPIGYYQITLKFAEIIWSTGNYRIFDVAINGQQVLTNFDIFTDAGGKDIADDKVFANIPANAKGQIEVQFTAVPEVNGVTTPDQHAKISAIEVDPQWSGTPYLGSTSESDLQNFLDQLAQLAQQGYASLTVTPSQLRVQDNEMQGLIGPGLLILDDDAVANGNTSSLIMMGNRINCTLGLALQGNDILEFVKRLESAGDANGIAQLGPSLLDFLYSMFTVSIVQVTQCLISSNIIASSVLSLFVDDHSTSTQQLMVMSNLLLGFAVIAPRGYPASGGLAAPNNVREALNTVLT